MRNIIINWVLPVVRQLGGVLDPTEIASVEIELSADAGVSYAPVGPFSRDVLSVPVNDLPFSDQYVVRGRVIDTGGAVGNWVAVPFTLADTSPPGDLTVTVDIL